jgi:hypothetical protein
MATALPEIRLATARDLRGRGWEIWVRRGLLSLICLVPVLALLDVFGQQAGTTTVTTNGVTLQVLSPSALRGGLLYEARFTIAPDHELKNATLELGPGWARGMTINTIEPSPTDETSVDGRLAFGLGDIKAGSTFVLHMEFQVNPTTIGQRQQTVTLYDDQSALVAVDHEIRVWP